MIKTQIQDKELYREFKAIPLKKDNKWSLLVKKWILKLGLQKEPICVLYEQKAENVFSFSKITWNPLKNYWEIHYKYPQNKYTIIHELGHLYLYKISGLLEYHKRQDLKLAKNISLAEKINLYEDVFVNTELYKFPEFFEICKKKAITEESKIWLYSAYYLPKSIDRVEYIKNKLYKNNKHSKKEINEYLKLRYGKLYK